jgi:hypothetical protein
MSIPSSPENVCALFPLVAYGPDLPNDTVRSWSQSNGQWVNLAEVRRNGDIERYLNGMLVYAYRPKLPARFSARVPFSGFYETSHDQRIDEAEEQMFSGDDGEIVSSVAYEAFWSNLNYGSVHEKYAKAYVAALAHGLKIPLDYEEMVSPREYNFTTDRLFAKISRSDFAKMLRAVRGKRLNEKVLDQFTSCSGFISFYPNSVSLWGRIADWDYNQVGTVLSCYIDKLHEGRAIPNERDIAEEHIDICTIEDWLAEAADGSSRSSCKAWAALFLNDLIRRRAEE